MDTEEEVVLSGGDVEVATHELLLAHMLFDGQHMPPRDAGQLLKPLAHETEDVVFGDEDTVVVDTDGGAVTKTVDVDTCIEAGGAGAGTTGAVVLVALVLPPEVTETVVRTTVTEVAVPPAAHPMPLQL